MSWFAFRLGNGPMRAALSWQLVATGVIASVAILFGGTHASISAALGGGVVILANAAYALTINLSAPRTAGATLRTMLRAEALKIAVVVLGLWLVFSSYREVMPLGLIGTFIVTVLVWPVALLYKD